MSKIRVQYRTEIFMWDHRELAPIKEIVSFARKNPELKMYQIKDGTDVYSLVFAKNKKDAQKLITGDDIGKIVPWKES